MSEHRNNRHLAIDTAGIRTWILEVANSATTFAGQRREALELQATLQDCLTTVFEPETLKYELWSYDGDYSDPRATAITNERPTNIVTGELEWPTDGRVDAALETTLTEACPASQCRVGCLETHGKTKVTLSDGDHWVDKETTEFVRNYSRDRQLDSAPTEDPFHTKIKYERGRDAGVDHVQYAIRLYTYTDIWGEDTEIGATNRERLRKSFKKLRDHLDIKQVVVNFEMDAEMGADLATALQPSDDPEGFEVYY